MHAFVKWVEYPRIKMRSRLIFGRVPKGMHRFVKVAYYHRHTCRFTRFTRLNPLQPLFVFILTRYHSRNKMQRLSARPNDIIVEEELTALIQGYIKYGSKTPSKCLTQYLILMKKIGCRNKLNPKSKAMFFSVGL
jgi:hypothetical protein